MAIATDHVQTTVLPPFKAHDRTPTVIGLCYSCIRWRLFDVPCGVCGNTVGDPWTLRNQVDYELAEVIIAMQDFRPPGATGTLYQSVPQLKEACNPKWRMNFGTNHIMMQRANELRGIAAQHGVRIGEQAGWQEVEVMVAGQLWHAKQLGSDMRLIAPVETVEAATLNVPDQSSAEETPPLYVSDKAPSAMKPRNNRRSGNPVATSPRSVRAGKIGSK